MNSVSRGLRKGWFMRVVGTGKLTRRDAFSFILLLGVISLLVDIIYEGARGVTGSYLALLGANATIVGFVAGFGELLGYGLRYFSGLLSDRTKRYWTITFIGYFTSVVAVPALALAGSWELAAMLIVMERVGKAVRSPAKDTMLSFAASEVGQGKGFGIHEALDQVGAFLGPLIIAAVLFFGGDYQAGFALMVIPAIMAIVLLTYAKKIYPDPRSFERAPIDGPAMVPSTFWLYMIPVALMAAAYSDFALISYHFEKQGLMSGSFISLFYAMAMGVDAISALGFGHIFDRIGFKTLGIATLASAFSAAFIFLANSEFAFVGIIMWGLGMGAQESIMRAAVARIVPMERRGYAYGVFNFGYGISWFAGSAIMGILYDISVLHLVVFSVVLQLASVPLFILLARERD